MRRERDALRRRQGLEHVEQRGTDRVGEAELDAWLDGRVGQRVADRIFATCLARAQLIEAEPRDDRRQPTTEVVDLGGPRAVEPEPGFLDRVVGLGPRAEHAERDRSQVVSVLLEFRGDLAHSGVTNEAGSL